MMGFIASVVEAYGEFRVNKARILLSLIGVAVSVFVMTGMLGGGEMLNSAVQQSIEKSVGRPTVITLNAGMPTTDAAAGEAQHERITEAMSRLGITQHSRRTSTTLRVQSRSGVVGANTMAVDPAYADMFRVRPAVGRWIASNDTDRLAPVAVISDSLHRRIGRPPVGTGTLTTYGTMAPTGTTTVGTELLIVGVLPADEDAEGQTWGMGVDVYVPAGALTGQVDTNTSFTEYLAWVPPESAMQVQQRLTQLLSSDGFSAYGAEMGNPMEEFDTLRTGVLVASSAILLLGALGLINISLVTVRYRLREIGIRRSYGATGARIFMGVLMENVVATVIAGVVGVGAAVALLRSPWAQNAFTQIGLIDVPPFPVSAVLIGLAAATAVGVLAGALPAVVATRMKVIDAIRA